jgi:hypothetical protein
VYWTILDGRKIKPDAAVAGRSKPQQVSTALLRLSPWRKPPVSAQIYPESRQGRRIGHATYGSGDAVGLFHDAAGEGMQAIPPCRNDHADAIFGAEEQMIVSER